MDPTLSPVQVAVLSAADLLALDLIGWDVNPEAFLAIPEPAATALLTASLALLCVMRRRSHINLNCFTIYALLRQKSAPKGIIKVREQ
jgi:hypothetical protein